MPTGLVVVCKEGEGGSAVYLLLFLIAFPLLAALVLALVKSDSVRNAVVVASGAIIGVVSIVTVIINMNAGTQFFTCSSAVADYVCLGISVVIGAVILGYAFKYKNILAGALAVVQLAGSIVFDVGFAHGVEVEQGLYLDSLSLIMTFIIGVIGTAICIYALGYMKDFQHHEPEGAKDRRPYFFALMFAFLSAMYVIVFSDNMSWLFIGWEVTTLCSFLLIGYTKTDEAIRNAFRQIIMNLIGGITFLAALFISVTALGTLSLSAFIAAAVAMPSVTVVAVICLAIAGITKAAQMPFQTWLLGAMVAPTPTSALLHSSTMVKAGVFLLVKLAPAFLACTVASVLVMLVGGVTFLFCSLMAITQSNAKRVLAYSTIANLGLITACAGVGTPEAVWAACFLILFHACAKSLLFMCVGTAEHHIGSRDIEDMDLLFERMPRLARFMMVGIMGMFVAPFGMLIAKWAALASFADQSQIILILVLAFGSAATFMFWAKWLGKLAGIAGSRDSVELTVHRSEWYATGLALVLTVLSCVCIVPISDAFVMPYLHQAFGDLYTSAVGINAEFIDDDGLWVTSILAGVIFVLVLGFLGGSKRKKLVPVYLAGVTKDGNIRTFRGSLGNEVEATARNWYMVSAFGEKKLAPIGEIFSTTVMLVALLYGILMVVGILG